jgi:hypothetical protein
MGIVDEAVDDFVHVDNSGRFIDVFVSTRLTARRRVHVGRSEGDRAPRLCAQRNISALKSRP